MARQKKFGVAELHYIAAKSKEGETVEQIAEALECSVDSVKPFYAAPVQVAVEPQTEPQKPLPGDTKPLPDGYAYSQFARNERYGTVIGTKAASEASDTYRQNNPSRAIRLSGQNVDCIHKPRGDNPIPR
jgi:hypothetical protein